MKLFKSLFCLAAILGLLVVLTGCPKTAIKADPKGMVYFSYFDTVSYIYCYSDDSNEEFSKKCSEASAILGEYHKLFDIYYEHAGVTNLRTLNLNAGGEPMKVDSKLVDFLIYAKELYTLTNGEMNIMMGSVLRLWHDAREAGVSIPSEESLTEAALHTDISCLEIDKENSTVRISDPLASIDVGALGKGYATEKAAEHLEEIGAESYVLNIGGNIRIIGTKPDGSGWLTGIKDPQNTSNYAIYINLANTSCVTSGVYERYFTVDGVRYHHIIDKDTLMPSVYFTSLTVLTKDSGLADALSTALFSMSYEDGYKIVESLDGVEVIWILADGEIRMSEGAKALVSEQ